MEGHPRYVDPGATPVPGHVDSSDATRKRVFLLLDGERRSLMAEVRPWWRLRRRYEDLSLVMMLAHLQRDWLSQPRPHLGADGHSKSHRDPPGHRLANWATPWGAAPRMKLNADIDRVDGALKRLGRWLSRRTVAKAGGRALERLDAITTELEQPRPQAPAASAAEGAATKTGRFDRPTRRRVAAIAGLFSLAAGAGAFLLTSHTGSGPGDFDRRGAVAGVAQHPGTVEVQIQRGSGQRGRAAGESASAPRRSGTQGSARARSEAAGQSEIAPPAPEPPSVPQPAAAPQPAPAPVPPSLTSSSTSTQAKGAGGGGDCPPEFGYEC